MKMNKLFLSKQSIESMPDWLYLWLVNLGTLMAAILSFIALPAINGNTVVLGTGVNMGLILVAIYVFFLDIRIVLIKMRQQREMLL